jgi:hypothetical protein
MATPEQVDLDETFRQDRIRMLTVDLPVRLPDMDAIIELINEGHYDDHLEDLLAAAHGRKREKRGCRRPYGVRT